MYDNGVIDSVLRRGVLDGDSAFSIHYIMYSPRPIRLVVELYGVSSVVEVNGIGDNA